MKHGSPLFLILHHHPAALLPKATFTLSIQPNLGLPGLELHLLPPSTAVSFSHTVVIHSLHVSKPSQYFLIHSTNSISITPPLSASSFLTLSIRVPKPYFSNTSSQEHSLFFSLHFLYPLSMPHTMPTEQLLPNTDRFCIYTEFSITQHSFQGSIRLTPIILRTTSIHILNPLPLVTPTTENNLLSLTVRHLVSHPFVPHSHAWSTSQFYSYSHSHAWSTSQFCSYSHSLATFFLRILYQAHSPVNISSILSQTVVLYHLQTKAGLSKTCHHLDAEAAALPQVAKL